MLELVLLAAAGALAGAVNAVAGGGSLISFPALLAAGHSALAANATNLVALVPGYATGTAAYRQELAGQGARARALGVSAAAGAAAGTALLLVAPADAFEAVAPFLVLGACALLAAQGPLSRAAGAARGRHAGAPLHVAVFAACIYGGYFGAGLGIVLLAALGALLEDDLQRLNALKGLLSLVVAVVAAAGVGIFGPVAWDAAAAVAAGALLGGRAGVGIARRLSADVLRWSVVAYGVVVAVVLLVR